MGGTGAHPSIYYEAQQESLLGYPMNSVILKLVPNGLQTADIICIPVCTGTPWTGG